MSDKKKSGKILILSGMLCIAVALCIHFMQEWQNIRAAQNSQILLEEIENQKFTPGIHQNTTKTEMPTVQYLSYSMIGTLKIDKLSLELPVLESWSYNLLQVAPCRYSGTTKSGEFIILAHNYKSHFGGLKNLEVNDEIIFEDVNGVSTSYKVQTTEILNKNDLDRLASEYDLSLFTCTPGGANRVAVRCVKG